MVKSDLLHHHLDWLSLAGNKKIKSICECSLLVLKLHIQFFSSNCTLKHRAKKESLLSKRYIYFGIILLCSLCAATVTAKELKIGFVNAVKVMEQAPQVSAANTRLEREFEPRQREIANGQREIKASEDKLNKDGAIMSEAQSRDLSRDIINKKRDLKRQQDEFREDYNIRRSEELDKLQKQIIEVIQAVAKEQSYDLILSDGVVWASDSIDMTDQVLKRLGATRSSTTTTPAPATKPSTRPATPPREPTE